MPRAPLALLAALLLLALPLPAGAAEPRTVVVTGFADAIEPSLLDDFAAETGIRVAFDPYDAAESVEARLLAGRTGIDVAIVPGPTLSRLLARTALQPLDRARLPDLRAFGADILARLSLLDPGNARAVPHLWGTVGLGLNPKLTRAALGERGVESWDILKPEVAARLKDCGLVLPDAADEAFPNVLRALGLAPDSKNPLDYQKAADALLRVRPLLRLARPAETVAALAGGEACAAMASSSDVAQARRRAQEARKDVEVAYAIPREGALMWIDVMAIPADAPHREEAHAFIAYMMRPESAARTANWVGAAPASAAARPLVRPELLNDPGLFPPEELARRLFLVAPPDERLRAVILRQWARVKAGKP